jgi:hypothetical protein
MAVLLALYRLPMYFCQQHVESHSCRSYKIRTHRSSQKDSGRKDKYICIVACGEVFDLLFKLLRCSGQDTDSQLNPEFSLCKLDDLLFYYHIQARWTTAYPILQLIPYIFCRRQLLCRMIARKEA